MDCGFGDAAHLIWHLSRPFTSGEKRVIPAQAGSQYQVWELLAGGCTGVLYGFGLAVALLTCVYWIPAFAGLTVTGVWIAVSGALRI